MSKKKKSGYGGGELAKIPGWHSLLAKLSHHSISRRKFNIEAKKLRAIYAGKAEDKSKK